MHKFFELFFRVYLFCLTFVAIYVTTISRKATSAYP